MFRSGSASSQGADFLNKPAMDTAIGYVQTDHTKQYALNDGPPSNAIPYTGVSTSQGRRRSSQNPSTRFRAKIPLFSSGDCMDGVGCLKPLMSHEIRSQDCKHDNWQKTHRVTRHGKCRLEYFTASIVANRRLHSKSLPDYVIR